MRVKTVLVTELGPRQFERCRQLTLAGDGSYPDAYMRPQLEGRHPGDYAIMAYSNRIMVGWALTSTETPNVSCWSPIKRAVMPCSQFYVHPAWRRRGVGTALLQEVERTFGKCTYFPWDDRSEDFFEAVRKVAV